MSHYSLRGFYAILKRHKSKTLYFERLTILGLFSFWMSILWAGTDFSRKIKFKVVLSCYMRLQFWRWVGVSFWKAKWARKQSKNLITSNNTSIRNCNFVFHLVVINGFIYKQKKILFSNIFFILHLVIVSVSLPIQFVQVGQEMALLL